ncbi:MAG: glycosyltransferase family 4 protein [Flavobacteriaceae bacterium]
MKVLFILSRIEKNGVTTHTLDLARGLIKQGHELVMITGGIYGGVTNKHYEFLREILKDFEDIGTEIHYFGLPKGNILSKSFTAIRSILKVLRLIASIKADVIHCQSPNTTFMPWLIGKKFITTVHSDLLKPNPMYKNPTKLIAVSAASKEYGIRVLRAKEEDVPIVLHGISKRFSESISEEKKEAIKTENNIPQDKILIGFVGRITKVKGLDILIKAIAEDLAPELREKVHLIFLGDYYLESDKAWLTGLIQESGIANQICLMPFQDPQPIYQIFDIFVLPSRSDTFGLVAVEAMMSGCCTVRSDSYGAYDQIDHGTDGFIFEMDNHAQLSQILTELLDNAELRAQVAQKGKAKALKHFTIDAMTLNTIEVYKTLL